jgi:hypothetical protein
MICNGFRDGYFAAVPQQPHAARLCKTFPTNDYVARRADLSAGAAAQSVDKGATINASKY